jgi:hypothetical protein
MTSFRKVSSIKKVINNHLQCITEPLEYDKKYAAAIPPRRARDGPASSRLAGLSPQKEKLLKRVLT